MRRTGCLWKGRVDFFSLGMSWMDGSWGGSGFDLHGVWVMMEGLYIYHASRDMQPHFGDIR